MRRRKLLSYGSIALLALTFTGCLRDATLDPNRAPIANAGEDQELEWDGAPVTVTLDGRGSRDLDGTTAGYDWRAVRAVGTTDAGAADAGNPDAAVAAGAPDPRNVARPTIELDRGRYAFTLWVRDDQGAVSRPDVVTVRVGTDPVEECVASTSEQLADPCRQCLCEQDATCQTAVPACGEQCWGLIGCISVYCPTFTMDNDIACVATHCADFVAEGQAGAMEAGNCLAPCSEACTESLSALAGDG